MPFRKSEGITFLPNYPMYTLHRNTQTSKHTDRQTDCQTNRPVPWRCRQLYKHQVSVELTGQTEHYEWTHCTHQHTLHHHLSHTYHIKIITRKHLYLASRSLILTLETVSAWLTLDEANLFPTQHVTDTVLYAEQSITTTDGTQFRPTRLSLPICLLCYQVRKQNMYRMVIITH